MPVLQTTIEGIALVYDDAEREAAALIGEACARAARLLREEWGLATPPDLQVHVMTAWLRFAFQSAPWHWRPLLAVTLPLWALRERRIWPVAGGWALSYGRRRVVGIKPPWLLQQADRRLGERVFIPIEDINQKVQHVTCHELTHAFAAHLRLPVWLNEGLAMLAVDRFAGQPTVRPDTLDALARAAQSGQPAPRGVRYARDPDALVAQYVRGYWLTRYLDETHPALLREVLSRRRGRAALEGEIAAACGIAPDEFHREIERAAIAHFCQ